MGMARSAQVTSDRNAKPFLDVLHGNARPIPPVWLMRQAGRYLPEYREVRQRAGTFLDLCYNPELATEVTLQPIRRFGFDAAILFSDILVVPHGLGQQVAFKEGEGPVLDPIEDGAAVGKLDVARSCESLAPVYEAVSSISAALPDDVALIGFAGAPWTVATYMVEGGTSRDFMAAKTFALSRPTEFDALINVLVDATTRHLIAQIEAGAEAVQLFDTWSGAVPEESFDRLVVDPAMRIVAGVNDAAPDIPVIGFPKGSGINYQRYAEKTGVSAVSLDSSVPLSWATEVLGSSVVLQGNLDPALVVAGGVALKDRVSEIKESMGNKAYIFNLGHGIVPKTPLKHVSELVSYIRQ